MHSDSQVVIVTGASRGIGFEVAQTLINRGHQVVITGRDPKRVAAAGLELDVLALVADAVSQADIEAVVYATNERFGRVDALINNAGVSASPSMVWNQDPDAWWRVLEVNVRGPMLAMRAVLPTMFSQGSGKILNMCSLAAVLPPIPGMSAYPTSKAALARLNELVAEEVRDHGVSVFSVSPGLVKTDMTRELPLFKDLPASAWTPISAIGVLVATLIEHDYSGLTGRFIHVHDDLDLLLSKLESIEEDGLYRMGMHTLDGRLK
ncbi:MAG: 3-oxoacyl-[acyl-carrier protein] reductase [Kiritimatiellia bacterium]|jgi:3-oxoacyl-[acyl-carrier protein] reductase